jgi:hypothetical protein
LSGCAIAVALLVAWGDYRTAVVTRRAAEEIGRVYAKSADPLRFQGHWGFQYYLEKQGATAADYAKDVYHSGDLVVVPKFASLLRPPKADQARLIDKIRIPYDCNIATVALELEALFYAQAAFPFRAIDQPPAECWVYEYR